MRRSTLPTPPSCRWLRQADGGAVRARCAARLCGAGGGALTGVLFFLAVVAIIPFGVGPDLALLARLGPAILWIGALLASLLGLDRLFQADREDGSLDLLVIGNAGHLLRSPC